MKYIIILPGHFKEYDISKKQGQQLPLDLKTKRERVADKIEAVQSSMEERYFAFFKPFGSNLM